MPRMPLLAKEAKPQKSAKRIIVVIVVVKSTMSSEAAKNVTITSYCSLVEVEC